MSVPVAFSSAIQAAGFLQTKARIWSARVCSSGSALIGFTSAVVLTPDSRFSILRVMVIITLRIEKRLSGVSTTADVKPINALPEEQTRADQILALVCRKPAA